MSAYICNPEHFGILAAWATLNECALFEWRHSRKPAAEIETAQRVAKGLARENIRSVAHRYPDTVSGNRPGPCLTDERIEEAAALYAAHFMTNSAYVRSLRPVQILVLCQGLDYQSCETDDWKDTLAWRQLDWIKNQAIRLLPGHATADWSYDRPLPEIEALYAKETTA